jgi:hypothetical protein
LVEILEWMTGTWLGDEFPILVQEDIDPSKIVTDGSVKRRPWAGEAMTDLKLSTRAMILRSTEGDTVDDGTVTATGERMFFGERHLKTALMLYPGERVLKNATFARVVANNIIERFGISADVDSDGVITNKEILGLKASARHGQGFGVFGAAAHMLANEAQHVADRVQHAAEHSAEQAQHAAHARQVELGENFSKTRGRLITAGEELEHQLHRVAGAGGSGASTPVHGHRGTGSGSGLSTPIQEGAHLPDTQRSSAFMHSMGINSALGGVQKSLSSVQGGIGSAIGAGYSGITRKSRDSRSKVEPVIESNRETDN